VRIEQITNYPWDGRIAIRVHTPGRFTLNVRQPAGATILLNGKPQESPAIARDWSPGDELVLDVPMQPTLVESHPHVAENTGRIAVTRGPIVYCAEAIDHPGVDLRDVEIDPDAPIEAHHDLSLLNGVTRLTTRAIVNAPEANRALYESRRTRNEARTTTPLTLVPYYAWANRAAGRMQVWHRVRAG
jgi:DUF1680 family protein